MITLGGTVCIRNGISLDYTLRETVQSLLPVCEQVVVCDGESTDGTWKSIQEWASKEPKIKPVVYPWPNPKGDGDFWVTWLNYAREHLDTDYNIELDADEILAEDSNKELLKFKRSTNPNQKVALWCNRFNFFRDSKSLIPHGHCLGHTVVRVGPSSVWMPSDGCHPKGAEMTNIAHNSNVEIFHYGFLRKKAAYFHKSRDLHTFFFGGLTDQRLLDVEHGEGNWMDQIQNIEWTRSLIPFTGNHPDLAKPWLAARGYST